MIASDILDFKGTTITNNHYCMVGQPLNWRYGNNVNLLISIETNEYFIVLIKEFELDPDMGVKMVHPSIYDDSEATYSD